MKAADVFTRIYDRDAWNGGSGPGSDPANAGPYIEFLGRFFEEFWGEAEVVDVGCGDWRLGAAVDWSHCHSYVGVDVVPSVIEANRERPDLPANVSFEVADALREDLPDGNVLLVKDVFQHWPNRDVLRFLRRHLDRYSYVIITNDVLAASHPAKLNSDIRLGGWRPIDMEADPFNLTIIDLLDYPVLDEWVKRVVVV